MRCSSIRRGLGIIIIVVMLASIGVLVLVPVAATSDWEIINLLPFDLPDKGNPKLDSQLNQLVDAEGQYYNAAPSFSNFGFDDDVALDDGWYQMDSYTGAWTALFTDDTDTYWDSNGWTIPGFNALAEGSHTIYFKASDDTGSVEGESGEWSWQFFKDTTPPTVGGTIVLVDKLGLVMPWMIVAALIVAAGIWLGIWTRRRRVGSP